MMIGCKRNLSLAAQKAIAHSAYVTPRMFSRGLAVAPNAGR